MPGIFMPMKTIKSLWNCFTPPSGGEKPFLRRPRDDASILQQGHLDLLQEGLPSRAERQEEEGRGWRRIFSRKRLSEKSVIRTIKSRLGNVRQSFRTNIFNRAMGFHHRDLVKPILSFCCWATNYIAYLFSIIVHFRLTWAVLMSILIKWWQNVPRISFSSKWSIILLLQTLKADN